MTSDAPRQLSSAGRRHALLVSRARRLARPRRTPDPVPTIRCLVCAAGLELFAIPLAQVARVAPTERPAPVPTSNPAFLGVIGRAGAFYQVYDLYRLLNAGEGGEARHVVMLRGPSAIALQVGEAIRVADIVELRPEDASSAETSHPAIKGFGRALEENLFDGRSVSLIDVNKLVSDRTAGRVEGD